MNEPAVKSALRDRLNEVEDRLRAACARAGRSRSEVTLLAVTKTVSVEVAGLLPELGVVDLGENRPQELWRKAAALPDVRWHLIGHLQRNKIERTLPLVHLIHSADSLRLLQALAEEADRRGVDLPVLIEVNIGREASKGGFAAEELLAALPQLTALLGLHLSGLMTMAAHESDPERCRPTFRGLRELRDRLNGVIGVQRLEHLSMGMSNDFEVAVEEGATIVRIGSALFEDLPE